MSIAELAEKYKKLPDTAKQEVEDFVDFLLEKRQRKYLPGKPQFGLAKGRFKMADDFDEPLEDFKDKNFDAYPVRRIW